MIINKIKFIDMITFSKAIPFYLVQEIPSYHRCLNNFPLLLQLNHQDKQFHLLTCSDQSTNPFLQVLFS